ncbi:winged helix-turn-helix transcriptional regulator [Frigidibacter sp. MR17.24]|uniref:winged helix-turn-helix transcriptional regulator n=1 Tax=Frigidibacter sp. MR17.24 TaxID=3127345 RepID=UPI003012B916
MHSPSGTPPLADVFAADCPSRQVLRCLASRWGVIVIVALTEGRQRFSGLRRRIGGISERMLAQTLQELEGCGIVERRQHPVVPPHVDYALTPLGQEAAERMVALTDWVEANLPRLQAPPAGSGSGSASVPDSAPGPRRDGA